MGDNNPVNKKEMSSEIITSFNENFIKKQIDIEILKDISIINMMCGILGDQTTNCSFKSCE